MTITLNGDTGITTPMYNGTISANTVTPSVNMKNRIINGGMVIDQRNAGASTTAVHGNYCVDRWQTLSTQASKYSFQQVSDAPVGFKNSLKITSLSAYSPTGSERFAIRQFIEGLNWYDLNWGTASALPVSLSFWVKSSLTGTFGGSINTNQGNAGYPIAYTINSANTWEYKTISIPAATIGTWMTDNTSSSFVTFSFGAGTGTQGTPNVWSSTIYDSSTGAVNVVATNAATWQITGVQLEVGSSATSFDYRPYGTELALCQRYYYQSATSSVYMPRGTAGLAYSTTGIEGCGFMLTVPMRATPTFGSNGLNFYSPYAGRAPGTGTVGIYQGTTDAVYFNNANNGSGMGANYVYYLAGTTVNSYISFSAEL